MVPEAAAKGSRRRSECPDWVGLLLGLCPVRQARLRGLAYLKAPEGVRVIRSTWNCRRGLLNWLQHRGPQSARC